MQLRMMIPGLRYILSTPVVRQLRLDNGQGLVEYALLMIFVAVGLIILLVILGPGLQNIYTNIVNNVQNFQ